MGGEGLRNRRRGNEYSGGVVPWLFLAPSLVLMVIFVLVPFLDVVRRSFFSAMGGQFVGIANYLTVLNNESFRLAASNTARFIALCLPILIVFSVALALLVNAGGDRRGVFKTTFLVPLAIPVASIVLLWRVVFHGNGLLNAAIVGFGLTPVDWMNGETALGVLIFSYIWKNAGYNMILWLSGLSGISPALYEAASLDGAGAFQRFRAITMPALVPTLFTVAALSVLNAFKVFREAYLLAGSYPHDSIYMLQHLFNNWFLRLDVDKMSAGAVMMAAAVFVLIMILQRLWGRES